jgi:hypothetical protein
MAAMKGERDGAPLLKPPHSVSSSFAHAFHSSQHLARKVREIAEHEDYELTQGTLDFIGGAQRRTWGA